MSTTEMQGMPPTRDVDADLKLVLPGQGLAAGAGWDWMVEGWKLFVRAPLMWIVSLVILFLVALALGFIPFIGQIVFQLIQPVIAGGFMVACRSLEKGGDFELEHLMQGFSQRFGPLLVVGLLFMLGWLLIIGVFVVVAGVTWGAAMMSGDAGEAIGSMMSSPGPILIWVLVMLGVSVPLMAAYWFAPALVMMHDMKPFAAMKESFFACFRNFVPFLLYGVVMMIGALLAMLPFGLGLLVWIPVAIASTYVAYRQIFTEG